MRAVRLLEIGGPANLRVEDIPIPRPGPGEALIRLASAALNRRDIYITQGLYPRIELPRTLGSDGVGTVVALGSGGAATTPNVGTRVVIDPELGWSDATFHAGPGSSILGMPRDGTFADYVVVPAANVYACPAGLRDDEAAALPLAGLTAYRAAFTRGRVTKDDVVLIPGVGGGVQTFVLLYVKHAGARAIVTSGSTEKLDRAKALGADAGINYQEVPDWQKAVRELTSGGPSLVIDSSGGETLAKCLQVARPGARVVVYGGTGGDATIRPYDIFWKHLDVLGTSMGSPGDFAGMLRLFEGGMRPVVDRVFAMDEAPAAAQRLLESEQFGKVVLAIT
jgi:zinc-binding alcohol dehydrogenase/oxidoreductase